MVKIKAAQLEKMERDLFIGQQLLEITRTKEYRGLNEGESGLTFEDWLRAESAEMMPDGKPMDRKTAGYLRGFYYFRQEVLGPAAAAAAHKGIPLPTSAYQVRPLLFLLDHLHREDHSDPRYKSYDERRAAEAKAIEIWKAAVSQANGVPTFEQVNEARLRDAAAEEHRLRGAQRPAPSLDRPSPGIAPPASSDHNPTDTTFFNPQPTSTSPAPTIPAWELQKDDNSLDAAAECKKVSRAINEAHKAIGLLRGILYSQIHKYGRDYLGFLRQVDAGVYSLHAIDDQIQQMGEDIDFIASLLVADVGEGELAQATIDIHAIPTRA
jgi:hypothetical protein